MLTLIVASVTIQTYMFISSIIIEQIFSTCYIKMYWYCYFFSGDQNHLQQHDAERVNTLFSSSSQWSNRLYSYLFYSDRQRGLVLHFREGTWSLFWPSSGSSTSTLSEWIWASPSWPWRRTAQQLKETKPSPKFVDSFKCFKYLI